MNPKLITALHDELELLTRRHVVVVDDHDGRFLGTRHEAPLYAKLRAATQSSGESGGQGGEKRTSAPLNVGAVDLLTALVKRVGKWYADELFVLGNERPRTDARLEVVTTKWASLAIQAYRRGSISDEGMQRRIADLRAIVASIRDLLDPPYRFELATPCPTCGTEKLGTGARALVVTELQPLTDSYVTCRACNEEWRGIHEARRLSYTLEVSS